MQHKKQNKIPRFITKGKNGAIWVRRRQKQNRLLTGKGHRKQSPQKRQKGPHFSLCSFCDVDIAASGEL